MSPSWHSKRAIAVDSVAVLHDLLLDEMADDRRLVQGYLESKRVLAEAFEALSLERYGDDQPFERLKDVLGQAMLTNFSDVPRKYLCVKRFGAVHALLYAYLSDRVGLEVSADELRVLTGDAVHTERRTRDLRTLGLKIDTFVSSGVSVYVLADAAPDVIKGSMQVVRKNINDDSSISERAKSLLLSEHGV